MLCPASYLPYIILVALVVSHNLSTILVVLKYFSRFIIDYVSSVPVFRGGLFCYSLCNLLNWTYRRSFPQI